MLVLHQYVIKFSNSTTMVIFQRMVKKVEVPHWLGLIRVGMIVRVSISSIIENGSLDIWAHLPTYIWKGLTLKAEMPACTNMGYWELSISTTWVVYGVSDFNSMMLIYWNRDGRITTWVGSINQGLVVLLKMIPFIIHWATDRHFSLH